ncbi:hypothetical protein KL928_004851 [Ogataea angusta]|uniref:Uncharacterized protein n=1 Tax=Pichia angusta TaxID=870730 RepID=A0AAN6I3E0_PICAN|nr:uncharacterized protein KL928_004851 [Ogataea angusta]KAG7816295.1 hypothetical protein KL928_004851 [Ogataea angusta]
MKNSTVDGLLPMKFPATLAAEEVAEGASELKLRLAEMLNSAGGLLLHSEPVELSQTDADVPVPSFEEAEETAESGEAEAGREKVTAEGLRIALLDDLTREVDELELQDGLAVAFAWGHEQFSVAQPQE